MGIASSYMFLYDRRELSDMQYVECPLILFIFSKSVHNEFLEFFFWYMIVIVTCFRLVC